jgi:hypothetical protein
MAARFWVAGGSGNWTSTSNWSAASGGASGASVPSTADTATFNASSGAGTATVNSSVTIQTLTMTGFTGTLAFGTNTISLNSTGTIFTGAATYNVTGTPLILCTNSSGTARTINAGLPTEANSISFQFVAGTGSTNFTTGTAIRSLVYSGTFTGSKASSTGTTLTIYGNLTFKSGMTIAAGTGVVTFAATSGTQNIVSAFLNLNFPITFSGTATYRLQDALLVGTTTLRNITLTSGTLDLNNFTLTNFGIFSSNNNNTRAIAFGTGSYVNIRSASATYWNFPDITNFSYTGTSNVSFSPTSGTCTIAHGTSAGGAEAKALNFTFGNSGATIALSSSYVLDLTLLNAGGVHTYTNSTPTIYGSYLNQNNFSSSSPFTSITFSSTNTSRTNFIQSVFASMPTATNISGGAGTIYKLSNSVTGGTWTVSSSFDSNSYNLNCVSFNFNNVNTKTITLNSTITISNQFIGTLTGTTVDFTGSSFVFGGSTTSLDVPNATFPSVTLNRSASSLQTLTIGSIGNTQTITNLLTNNSPSNAFSAQIQLVAGSTLNVSSLLIDGNSSIVNILAGGTLSKSSGTVTTSYLNISNNIATGGATWLAPTANGNVDGGGNTGWIFGGGYTIAANNGSYAVTGQSASLLRSKILIANNGSYAVTGQSATLLRSKALSGVYGSYTVTGQSATLLRSKALSGVYGTYAVTGQSATLLRAKVLSGDYGAYTIAGQTASLLRSKALSGVYGSYTVTGQSATLLRSKALSGNYGFYTITGQSATLSKSRFLLGDSGTYGVTGQNAVITYGSVTINTDQLLVKLRSFTEKRRF